MRDIEDLVPLCSNKEDEVDIGLTTSLALPILLDPKDHEYIGFEY